MRSPAPIDQVRPAGKSCEIWGETAPRAPVRLMRGKNRPGRPRRWRWPRSGSARPHARRDAAAAGPREAPAARPAGGAGRSSAVPRAIGPGIAAEEERQLVLLRHDLPLEVAGSAPPSWRAGASALLGLEGRRGAPVEPLVEQVEGLLEGARGPAGDFQLEVELAELEVARATSETSERKTPRRASSEARYWASAASFSRRIRPQRSISQEALTLSWIRRSFRTAGLPAVPRARPAPGSEGKTRDADDPGVGPRLLHPPGREPDVVAVPSASAISALSASSRKTSHQA